MLADRADVLPTTGERFAVVDIETSGLSVRWHRILQVGVVVVDRDGSVLDQWSTFVRPRWRFQRLGPRQVHGLTRAVLRTGIPLPAAMHELSRRLDGAVFCAHNAAFEAAFLERAAHRHRVELLMRPRLCTLRLSRRLDAERRQSHRLADLCTRYGVSLDHPHDALCDAMATAEVLPHLLRAHGEAGTEALASLYES